MHQAAPSSREIAPVAQKRRRRNPRNGIDTSRQDTDSDRDRHELSAYLLEGVGQLRESVLMRVDQTWRIIPTLLDLINDAFDATHHVENFFELPETADSQKTLQDIIQRHTAGNLSDNSKTLSKADLIYGATFGQLPKAALSFSSTNLSASPGLLSNGQSPIVSSEYAENLWKWRPLDSDMSL